MTFSIIIPVYNVARSKRDGSRIRRDRSQMLCIGAECVVRVKESSERPIADMA